MCNFCLLYIYVDIKPYLKVLKQAMDFEELIKERQLIFCHFIGRGLMTVSCTCTLVFAN